VVQAYSEHDPVLYTVYASKHPCVTITELAGLIKSLWYCPSMGCRGPFPLSSMVADASALQAVEEMRQHHRLPLEAAEKPGKRGVIEVMNADLQTSRLKLLPEAMSIAEEWQTLIWDERKLSAPTPSWVEAPRLDNHLADAALYSWRKCRNYDALPEVPKLPAAMTPEWEAMQHERRVAAIIAKRGRDPLVVDEIPDWADRIARY
jgi:hypothetical protein